MVADLARALVPDGLDADEAQEAFRRLYNEGIRAAFPTEGGTEYVPLDEDEAEILDFYRGMPPAVRQTAREQMRALKGLKAIFDEEDAADNSGNVGKRAKDEGE